MLKDYTFWISFSCIAIFLLSGNRKGLISFHFALLILKKTKNIPLVVVVAVALDEVTTIGQYRWEGIIDGWWVCVWCVEREDHMVWCVSWEIFLEIIEIHTKSNRALIPFLTFDAHGHMHAHT